MKNWMPVVVAAAAIVVTQICCTWVIVNKLKDSDTSELEVISEVLHRIESQAKDIEHYTEETASGVEYLSETPEERRIHLQQRIEAMKAIERAKKP